MAQLLFEALFVTLIIGVWNALIGPALWWIGGRVARLVIV